MNRFEKCLKANFKKKITINKVIIILFMITGNIAVFGDNVNISIIGEEHGLEIGDNSRARGKGSIVTSENGLATGENSVATGGDNTSKEDIERKLQENQAKLNEISEVEKKGVEITNKISDLQKREQDVIQAGIRVEEIRNAKANAEREAERLKNAWQTKVNESAEFFRQYQAKIDDLNSRLTRIGELGNVGTTTEGLDETAEKFKQKVEQGTTLNLSKDFYKDYITNYYKVLGDLRINNTVNNCIGTDKVLPNGKKNTIKNIIDANFLNRDLKDIVIQYSDDLLSVQSSYWSSSSATSGISESFSSSSYTSSFSSPYASSYNSLGEYSVDKNGIGRVCGIRGYYQKYNGKSIKTYKDISVDLTDQKDYDLWKSVKDGWKAQIHDANKRSGSEFFGKFDTLTNGKSTILFNMVTDMKFELVDLDYEITYDQWKYEQTHDVTWLDKKRECIDKRQQKLDTNEKILKDKYKELFGEELDDTECLFNTIGKKIQNDWKKENIGDVENKNKITTEKLTDELEKTLGINKNAIKEKQEELDRMKSEYEQADRNAKGINPSEKDLILSKEYEQVKTEIEQMTNTLKENKAKLKALKDALTLYDLKNKGKDNIAYGTDTLAVGNNAIAFGKGTKTVGENSISFGVDLLTTGKNNTNIGQLSQVTGEKNQVIGYDNKVNGVQNLVIGNNNKVITNTEKKETTPGAIISTKPVVSVPEDKDIEGKTNIKSSVGGFDYAGVRSRRSVGANPSESTPKVTTPIVNENVLQGNRNEVFGNGNIVFGSENKVGTETKGVMNNILFGNKIDATNVNNAIVFGNESKAIEGAVSFGNDKTTRQLKFVSEGKNGTDAVNFSQLKDYVKKHAKGKTVNIKNELISKLNYDPDTYLKIDETYLKYISGKKESPKIPAEKKLSLNIDGVKDALGKDSDIANPKDKFVTDTKVHDYVTTNFVSKGDFDVTKFLKSSDLDVVGDDTYITVTPNIDKTKKTYKVAFNDTKLADTITNNINNYEFDKNKSIQDMLSKKADKDASNLEDKDIENWQNKLGTGSVADKDNKLVKGDTVFTYVNNIANTIKQELSTKATGDLTKKLNTDADNLTETGITNLTNTLGKGAIIENNSGLVTGGVVKTYVDDQIKNNLGTINTSLSSKLSDITITGDKYITANKVNNSKYTLTLNEDELNTHLNSYDFKNNTTIQTINNNIKGIDDKKANINASNLGDADVTAWQNKLGNGEVKEGNTGLVNGGVVKTYVDSKIDTNTNTINTKLDKKLDKDGLDIKGDDTYITVTPSDDKGKKTYTVKFDDTKLTNAITGSDFSSNTSIKSMLDKKADLDGTNLKNINLNVWQAKLGNGTIDANGTGLVTGGTVYNYINPIKTQVDQLSTSLNDKLSDITINGDTYIKTEKASKGVYNLSLNEDTLETLINSKTADLAKNDAITNINKELEKKANKDASNLEDKDVTKWQEKLGNGSVTEGDTKLVKGGTVFTYVNNSINTIKQQLSTKATEDLAKKLDIDANNLNDTGVTNLTNKLGTGVVAENNTGLVTGGKVYSELNKVKDELNKSISTNTQNITDLKNKYTTLNDQVTTNTSDISKLKTTVNDLKNTKQDITKINTKLGDIDNSITNINTKLDNKLDKADLSITGDKYIGVKKDNKFNYTLSFNKTDLEKDLDLTNNTSVNNMFTTKLGDINTNIGDLTTKVENNTNNINSLTTKVETNTNDITTLKQDMTKKLNVDADNLTTKGETNLINKLSKGSDISKPNNKLVTDTQVNTFLNDKFKNFSSIDNRVINNLQQSVTVVNNKADVALAKSDLALGGVANAIAMASLTTTESGLANLTAAYGTYGKEHALAIGFNGTTPNRRMNYKFGLSTNMKGNLGIGAGIGFAIGGTTDQIQLQQARKIKELEKKLQEMAEVVKELQQKISK